MQYPKRNLRIYKKIGKIGVRFHKDAGNLKLCTHPQLKKRGYHIIHFMRHCYLVLYRIEGTTAYVDAIYHQLQDYENTFRAFLQPPPRTDMQQGNQTEHEAFVFGSLLSFVLSVFFSCSCVKSALHFHTGNTGIYLLPCRTKRIIADSFQSPMYFRLCF